MFLLEKFSVETRFCPHCGYGTTTYYLYKDDDDDIFILESSSTCATINEDETTLYKGSFKGLREAIHDLDDLSRSQRKQLRNAAFASMHLIDTSDDDDAASDDNL